MAFLLRRHIFQLEPDTPVIYLVGWSSTESGDSYLHRKGWRYQNGAVLILDEAQASYQDTVFWNTLKAIRPESPCRYVTFASFGSVGHDPYDLTPGISPKNTVSLKPGDVIGFGLLLTKPEFDEFVGTVFVDHCFDVSLLDSIFDLTNGHVGACEDLLRAILGHPVSLYSYLKITTWD